MEIRLIVNGNLVHTMSMPKLQLISSKNDIFFATTAPEFFPNRTDRLFVDRQQELQKLSPPSSPNGKKINTKRKSNGDGVERDVQSAHEYSTSHDLYSIQANHFGTMIFPSRLDCYTGCRKINVFQVGGLVGKNLRNLEKIK
jgi:hypothetical protein